MSFDQKEMFHLMYKLARLTGPDTRLEYDTLGAINVPLDRLFGPQTMRSLTKFPIGGIEERMPRPIIIALGILKKAGVMVNKSEALHATISDAILKAADDVISGKLYDEEHFPLVIWQPGSGQSTNINVNEVITNRAIEIMGGQVGSKNPVDPEEHINMHLRSSATFSSAINIAVAMQLRDKLFPSLDLLRQALEGKETEFQELIKIGRTHLMDAEPLTLGQVFSGYKQMMINSRTRLDNAMERLYQISLAGSAVGPCNKDFTSEYLRSAADISGLPLVLAENQFESLAAHDALVELHGELNCLAVSLMKVVNDICFLGSGPRCGFGELHLPEYAPGKSVLSNAVTYTPSQVMALICAQVMGNQVAVTVGGYSGHFELNAFMPLIASNVLRSIALLGDGMQSLAKNCIEGIQPNKAGIAKALNESLVLALALPPYIGQVKAEYIAKKALASGTTVRQECFKNGVYNTDLDVWLKPEDLLGPK